MKRAFKKTVLLLIVSMTLITCSGNHSPHDTVVVFDIHDVLMATHGNNKKLKTVENQRPIGDTWRLVVALKKAGYPLYIFSNIGKRAFDQLCVKFPDHFALFDGHHVVVDKNANHRKPAPSSYASCKKLIQQRHAGKKIVFIDDRKENIKAAHKAGFTGIRFTSAAKLKTQLKPLLG